MSEYRDKLRSLGFQARHATKVTRIDARDTGAEAAVITEHRDRTDVEITTPTITSPSAFHSPTEE